MNITELKSDLTRHEGRRLSVYDDANGNEIVAGYTCIGHPTIGVGRNLTRARGISGGEADVLLAGDIADVLAELRARLSYFDAMPEEAQRALANMCFNMGWPRLSQFKIMLAHLSAGHYGAAAVEALDSRWAGQVGARATDIAELFHSASDAAND
jgi:lysozyme